MPPNITDSSISGDEVRKELDTILHSQTFERSERLQKFLQYVCDVTLRGESSRINEYLIGNEVFQRGANYSPHEDSVVRRQAHALRRKLQEYYEREGRSSAIRIELPVGRYVPTFRRREDSTVAQMPAETTVPPQSPVVAPARRRTRWAVVTAVAAAAVFLFGLLAGRTTVAPAVARSSVDPALAEIWGDWLRDPAGAVICFSNPMTAVVKHFPVPQPPNTAPRRLPPSPEQDKLFREIFNLPASGYLYLSPAISQGKMGEAIAAVRIAALFAGAGVPVGSTQSRFLSWEDLPNQNLVLFGHDEANRWIDPLLEKYPFRLSSTHGAKQRAIVIREPRAGEQAEYRIQYADDMSDSTSEYVLVSMIAGVDGRRKLLLISGLNTQATQGATEYLTRPSTAQELLGELRKKAPGHRGPWRFQAVLNTEVHDKVPTKAALVALRVF